MYVSQQLIFYATSIFSYFPTFLVSLFHYSILQGRVVPLSPHFSLSTSLIFSTIHHRRLPFFSSLFWLSSSPLFPSTRSFVTASLSIFFLSTRVPLHIVLIFLSYISASTFLLFPSDRVLCSCFSSIPFSSSLSQLVSVLFLSSTCFYPPVSYSYYSL